MYLQCSALPDSYFEQMIYNLGIFRKGSFHALSASRINNRKTKVIQVTRKDENKLKFSQKEEVVKHLRMKFLFIHPIFRDRKNFFIFSISVVRLIFKLAAASVTDPPLAFFNAPLNQNILLLRLDAFFISILSKNFKPFLIVT